MWNNRLLTAGLLACLAMHAEVRLQWLPEHLRPDPFGGIVAADRAADSKPLDSAVTLRGARDGYVSVHVLVSSDAATSYTLRAEVDGLEVDVFREWFHYMPAEKAWYPDALIPVRGPVTASLPQADNKIQGQRTQAYWLDVWIPKAAQPGVHSGRVVLTAGSFEKTLPVRIEVLEATVPAGDVVVPDHNSYGTSWLSAQYPGVKDVFGLIHAYHRIFYEHRGVFHQLGYGHGGKVAPEFAPELSGSGRTRHIANWDLYDRHYGPLLDGTAFASTRRGAKPIPFVYLPINPEWPAQFVNWGEKGYEAEFVNVVSEMERHFREKNWTGTRFELFFNHKKRYKAFPWDGDETRFDEDYAYFREYSRLMKKAMPADSPVKWVFRTDASWTMAEQFRRMAGIIDFWVVSGGMLSLYDWAPQMLHDRGDILWTYGGTPKTDAPASSIATELLKAWLWGASGYVHWLAVSPGSDPWFASDGEGTALVYPGTRFGLPQPIPGVRLKLQRNMVQDLNLLQGAGNQVDRSEVTRRFNGTKPNDWWTRDSPLLKTKPLDWNNTDIGDALADFSKRTQPADASSWSRVREYTLDVVRGHR
jgi:hypothetical protein